MMKGKGIRHRRGRKKKHQAFELQLTSMMDILVIIVVFLLKNYSVSTNHFTVHSEIELPFSSSPQAPSESLLLQVTPHSLLFETEPIVSLQASLFKMSDLDPEGNLIPALYERLKKETRKEGLALEVDKHTRYPTLQKIFHTATAAGYPKMRLIAMKRETE